jgi:hypothetical protein
MWCWRKGDKGRAGGLERPIRSLSPVPLALALCVLLAGCALFETKEVGPPLRTATAEELTSLLRQRGSAIESIKGLFSAKVRGGLLPIASRMEGTVYYRKPNALRLRGFTPVGGEIFELVQADDQYKLRLPTMGRVLVGRQSDMSEMGKLARPFQLSVWAMAGLLGTDSIGPRETVRLREDGDRYRLDVYAAAAPGTEPVLARRLWFERRTLLVVQEERIAPGGEVDAVIRYEDFRPLDNAAVETVAAASAAGAPLLRPFKISLEDGRGQGSVQVTFHEIVPNQTLKAEDLGHIS